jgi:hypothetical protein
VSDGHGKTAASLTNAVRRPKAKDAADSFLFFTVYGKRYFLNEVRWAGYSDARSLLKSKTETEIAQNFSAPQVTTTAIAAK